MVFQKSSVEKTQTLAHREALEKFRWMFFFRSQTLKIENADLPVGTFEPRNFGRPPPPPLSIPHYLKISFAVAGRRPASYLSLF